MRPVTKVILVVSLVALAVVMLYVASSKWGSNDKPSTPAVADRGDSRTPNYNDPVATYQRWRDRLPGHGDSGTPTEPARRAAPGHRDLESSSRAEGTIVALRQDGPVAGADPPGPILRPAGVVGEIITGRLRGSRDAGGSTANTHTIVQGDTLCGIATRYYGDVRYVQAIEAANPGIDPNRLKVGERLALPEKKAEKTAATSSPSTPTATAAKVYVVQKNDTLIGIARKTFGDAAMYPRIYEANKDVLSSPNARLYIGQRLRLPEPK